jgi:hypothetical protein
MKKETRNIKNFDKINFKDFGTLILTQGDQESLTIEADEALLPELIAKVQDSTLILGIDDDWLNRLGKVISSVFNSTQHKITYHLTVVNLEKISISGKCHLECQSLQTDTLKLNLSGWGNLTFTHLDCNALEVRISGRGEFSATGRADQQTVRISGSAEYSAPDLVSQSLRIVISGQANAAVRVEESLDIRISGMGQVNYYGRPKLRQVISGLGKSKRLNNG